MLIFIYVNISIIHSLNTEIHNYASSAILFQGNWMLLAQWDTVHGWPYGIPGAFDYYGDIDDVSSKNKFFFGFVKPIG